LHDCFDLVIHDAYFSVADDMTAELDLRLIELALRWIQVEFVLCQDLEYLPESDDPGHASHRDWNTR
jgi:hypothetical protein